MKSILQSGLQRHWLVALALGAFGFALNQHGLPIFGSVEIVFGGWATLLAVYWLGPWWGTAATALAFSLTWMTAGHPWILICSTLEAIIVGWLIRNRRLSPLVAASFYWLCLGMPIAALAVLRDGSLPFPDNWALVLRLPLNSFLAAIAVLPVFYNRRFRLWARLPLDREEGTPLQRVLFRRFGLIITLSIAALSLLAGRVIDQSLRNSLEDELVADSREVTHLLGRYLARHQQAIELLAGSNRVTTVANYSLAPQLANLRAVYPSFITALAADESGQIVAAAPGPGRGTRPNLSVGDRDYFVTPLTTGQPFVSNVFRGRGFGQDLIVAVSAPLLTPARRPIGIVEGSLNLNQLIAELSRSGQLDGRAVVILDRADHVVASQGALRVPVLTDFRHHELRGMDDRASGRTFGFDVNVDGTLERFVGIRSVVPHYDWEIILAEPVWRTQRVTARYYLFTLLGAVLATGFALWLARGTAREITGPLNDLVAAIRQLASPGGGGVTTASRIQPVSRELTELSDEIHAAALALSRSNRELASTIVERDQTQENLRGLLLHLEDLVRERTTELEVARQVAESASQAKTEFLASMSHELRTPLNVIVGMSELMAEQTLGPLSKRQTEGLQNIHESGRHLLDLINDILDLSKIEAGQLQLDFQAMEIPGVCATSVRFVREAARRKEIRVETSVSPDLAPVLADERRVKQILVNLLANAVKFTPTGGRIGLDARVDTAGQLIRFDVWDTGIGIASSNFERIFQPFQQIDSSLSRQYSGTGLGLALVRRMAGLHGGTVEVQSEPGKGSRFIVLLPWRPESSSPANPPAATGTAFPFSAAPFHILVAEDNAANRHVYAAYFSTRPCRVTYAANGQEAIELALTVHPDLVLMDVHMPVLDGLEAMRRLRADARTATLPIIAVTALAMPEDCRRCLEAGANAYLPKPINMHELSRLIARFTAVHRPAPLQTSAP